MAHEHSHAASVSGTRLSVSIALTLAFVVGELIAGYFAHSLALISDAGHNFADALALILSAYALWIARRPSNAKKTFGYHRVAIMAALVNALSLVVIAVFIAIEAIERLRDPVAVHAGLMIWVAAAAIVINALIAFWLHAGSKDDLNVRSAYLHMLGDAIAACGVVIAGVVVALTGASIADPIVSLLIGALILWSSWGILWESVNVLLEGTPHGMDLEKVIEKVRSVSGVLDIHDFHVWTVGPGVIACSLHIVVAEQSVREGQQVLKSVKHELVHHFRINHTTVQVEVEGCEPDAMYCTVHPAAEHEHEHSIPVHH
jgi:cobalt-zinc-cadmium efflux system protein